MQERVWWFVVSCLRVTVLVKNFELELELYSSLLCTNPFTSCLKNPLDNTAMFSFGALIRATWL